jgi:hypothetical protein
MTREQRIEEHKKQSEEIERAAQLTVAFLFSDAPGRVVIRDGELSEDESTKLDFDTLAQVGENFKQIRESAKKGKKA